MRYNDTMQDRMLTRLTFAILTESEDYPLAYVSLSYQEYIERKTLTSFLHQSLQTPGGFDEALFWAQHQIIFYIADEVATDLFDDSLVWVDPEMEKAGEDVVAIERDDSLDSYQVSYGTQGVRWQALDHDQKVETYTLSYEVLDQMFERLHSATP